jgi:hypothetical protein
MKRGASTPLATAKRYDEANQRFAREILANPEKYGGEDSGLVVWARKVVEKAEVAKCEN